MLPLKVGRSVHGTLEGLIIASAYRMLAGLILVTVHRCWVILLQVYRTQSLLTAGVHRGARSLHIAFRPESGQPHYCTMWGARRDPHS